MSLTGTLTATGAKRMGKASWIVGVALSLSLSACGGEAAVSPTVTVTATVTSVVTASPPAVPPGPAPEIAAALEEACELLATGGEPTWDDMTMLGPFNGQPLMIEDVARLSARAEDLYGRAVEILNYLEYYSLPGSTEYGMLLTDLGARLTYARTLRAAADDYLEGDTSQRLYDRILYFYNAYTASIELRLRGCPA